MREYTASEVADLIDRFIDGAIGDWEWDDFTTPVSKVPEIEALRREVISIPDTFPPRDESEWCSAAGIVRLQEISMRLKR